MQSIRPSTGEVIHSWPMDTRERVTSVLDTATEAWRSWRDHEPDTRADVLRQVAALLRDRRDALATRMADEMGKPVREGASEVDKCAWLCEHQAEAGPGYLAPRVIETSAAHSEVRYEPLGPILAIMPWNFPLWQVIRFAAPAVMLGNPVLLKHADNVQGCAEDLVALFEDAGAPRGWFANLRVDHDTVAELIADRRVAGVTLTGSVGAGRAVAEQAGRALKPVVLELGGSDPFIVLDDADLDAAVRGAVLGRTLNGGQSCIAAKRFLVADALHDAFVERLRAEFDTMTVGDPHDPDTDVGPMARIDLAEKLRSQVRRSVDAGARVVLGGDDGDGAWVPLTILTGVRPGMAAFDEEVFGPVAAVVRVGSADEAIELANGTTFGLGASVWSGDRARAESMVPRLHAGTVAINGIVRSDPRLPFGGIRDSGVGRELAFEGAVAFANAKTVWIEAE